MHVQNNKHTLLFNERVHIFACVYADFYTCIPRCEETQMMKNRIAGTFVRCMLLEMYLHRSKHAGISFIRVCIEFLTTCTRTDAGDKCMNIIYTCVY
jgi:hypothetical protein